MNVIITGSSKGIGKAIAIRFAAAGYNILLCSREINKLEATAKEIQESFPAIKVHSRQADLSQKSQVVEFAKWCLEKGDPHILVNNAGSYLPGNCIDEPDGNLETMIQINLYSAYHLTRALMPAFRAKGGGHIFNMCSIASLHAYEGGGSYSISKFALNGFSQNLRNELKNDRVKVTAVFPGAVFTDSWKGFDNRNGRIMEAEDIAALVVSASQLSPQANVDEIVIRPVLGDL